VQCPHKFCIKRAAHFAGKPGARRPPLSCRTSPPQVGRFALSRFRQFSKLQASAKAVTQPISPLVGEMSDRTEGGASLGRVGHQQQERPLPARLCAEYRGCAGHAARLGTGPPQTARTGAGAAGADRQAAGDCTGGAGGGVRRRRANITGSPLCGSASLALFLTELRRQCAQLFNSDANLATAARSIERTVTAILPQRLPSSCCGICIFVVPEARNQRAPPVELR
jgi:hypothetical protein